MEKICSARGEIGKWKRRKSKFSVFVLQGEGEVKVPETNESRMPPRAGS